ncbi:hypothetical protein PQZ36_00710 [Flavobacteriaceae bacterium]|nr:hypothetical protein [Flavobacteriaceae bacterium]
MKFNKIIPTLIFFIFTSCSKPNLCPNFDFNTLEKITTLNNRPYTGRCSKYSDGKVKSIQQYLNGLDYGKWVFYYENGKVQTKGRFNKNGERIGVWRYFYPDGNRKQISKYSKLGERTGMWKVYNQDGDLIDLIDYNLN